MKISGNAFIFCKVTITVLAWTAFIFRMKPLMLVVFALLLSSAILKIKKAPLIVLYSSTIGKLTGSKMIDLDEDAMRFAHTLGSVFSGICVLLVYLDIRFAWGVVLIFAVMKTISALGYCPGEKVYSCMKNGCCAIKR